MTNALISTIVAAAATFLAAGLVIQFAVGSSKAAQQELRGGVQIDDPRAMYQLIMYDALIAYQCDPSAGGNLDNTGNNDWASWQTYKRAADASAGDSFGAPHAFTFQDLNESFRGDELNCYGTETSIGGRGVYEAVHPSSREWRNDQEGEHSRIRWTVNSSSPIELKECIFFDQSKNMGGTVPAPAHNPGKGWGEGGITDMVFYMVDNTVTNTHDYRVVDERLVEQPDCHKIGFNLKGGGSYSETSPSGYLHANFLTVNFISDDGAATYSETWGSGTTVSPPNTDGTYGNQIRGPDVWADHSDINLKKFKLCPGARGYIQTNTGWTDNDPNTETSAEQWQAAGNKQSKNYMKAPPYLPDYLPGNADREKYSSQDDDQDNSVHPIVVIEDKGTC